KAGGIVTLDGAPVENATVTLVPVESGPSAVAKTAPDGSFKLTTHTPEDGAIPGQYQVSVSKVEVENVTSQEEAEKLMSAGKPVPKTSRREVIPKKFTNAKTSEIEVTISEGEDNHL